MSRLMLMAETIRDDILAIFDRDPAATNLVEVLLTYPGLHAILLHRLAHGLYRRGVPVVPRLLSHLNRAVTGIEIHPGARIGRGFFIDHGMGVVIGETSEIGDNCHIYQGVTLGGTGKERGKRHPTLGNYVLVGVGAKVLGAVTIGDHARVGAGAVVLNDVPPHGTAVGVPAKVVVFRDTDGSNRRVERLPDPELDMISALHQQVEALSQRVQSLEQQLQGHAEAAEAHTAQLDAAPGNQLSSNHATPRTASSRPEGARGGRP
jgi:serine O-acetyltransferase